MRQQIIAKQRDGRRELATPRSGGGRFHFDDRLLRR
jgi:hypothetical protein